MDLSILKEVYDVIEDRKIHPKSESYVASLFSDGILRIISKIEEESGELMVSVYSDGKSEIIHEAVDLIFHTFVLLVSKDINLEEILQEFRRRRK